MAEDAKKSTTANDGRSIPLWQAIEYLLDGNVGLTRSYRERRRRYDQKKNEWVLAEIERRGARLFGVDQTSDKRVMIEPAGLSVSYKIVYWHTADLRPIPRLQTRSTLHPTIINHVYVEREPLIAKTEVATLMESPLAADATNARVQIETITNESESRPARSRTRGNYATTQQNTARKVLDNLYADRCYPEKAELTDPQLISKCKTKFVKMQRLGKFEPDTEPPSDSTYLRAAGRKD